MTVPSYTEEDVELGVAAILKARHGAQSWTYEKCMKAILDHLAARGRLVPPGSETREEWGTRHLDIESGEWLAGFFGPSRDKASASLDYLSEVWGHHAELISRRVITTPWSPSVPDTKEGGDA